MLSLGHAQHTVPENSHEPVQRQRFRSLRLWGVGDRGRGAGAQALSVLGARGAEGHEVHQQGSMCREAVGH